MTAYPLTNQTALFAGDKQTVHRYAQLQQQQGLNPQGVAQNLMLRGTALGAVPAPNGSPAGTPPTFVVSKAGATDGSQHIVAVLAADADASAGAITVPAYFDGEFAFERMIFDPSWASFGQVDADLLSQKPGIYCRQLGILG